MTGVFFRFTIFAFAPAKNFIKQKPPRPRRRPGAPGARRPIPAGGPVRIGTRATGTFSTPNSLWQSQASRVRFWHERGRSHFRNQEAAGDAAEASVSFRG